MYSWPLLQNPFFWIFRVVETDGFYCAVHQANYKSTEILVHVQWSNSFKVTVKKIKKSKCFPHPSYKTTSGFSESS